MQLQNKPGRKLELKKKTISRLGQAQMNQAGGDSWTIYQFTVSCGSDFTRVTIISSTVISH